MITLTGKYNSANIMLEDADVDASIRSQIYSFLNHPAFANSYISIMPDCHVGIGSCIGFTMKLNDYVIPNLIGVDIGCGILCVPMGIKRKDFDRKDFEAMIQDKIPMGTSVRRIKAVSRNINWVMHSTSVICTRLKLDYDRVENSIGTLGGGNHFIEVDVDQDDNLYLVIHSGSRNFGLQVANYYQDRAKDFVRKAFIKDIPTGLEFLMMDNGGEDYVYDMKIAIQYAALNRATIAKELGFEKDSFDTIHNYIGDDNIIRKGAISAKAVEKCAIPFNMRDGVAICVGKGNSKWNNSAPHGAGRLLSRSKAKESLNLETFLKQMNDADIYTTTASQSTLDEAPDAYKPMELILSQIGETVDIIKMIKPIMNVKSA